MYNLAKRFAGQFELKDRLIDHVCSLVQYMCSPSKRVQDAVFNHCRDASRAVEYLLVQPVAVEMLLEVASVFSVAYHDEISAKTVYSYSLIVNHKKVNLMIPRGLEARKRFLNASLSLCKEWVIGAAGNDLAAIQAILQDYIFRHSQADKRGHLGVALAMRHGSEISSDGGLGTNVEFVHSWQRHVFHQGANRNGIGKHSSSISLSASEERTCVKEEFKYFVKAAVKKRQIEANRLEDVFYRATAIVLDDKEIDTELVHLICWTPVQMFTEESLHIATQVWSRIMVLNPSLEILMMYEFLSVFEWSIRRSRGIFSQKFNVGNIFSKKMTSGPSRISKELEISHNYFKPHLVFINFMAGHYESIRGSSTDHSALYTRFIQSTLQRRGENSNHPVARLCYFKLWLLARTILNDRPEFEHVRYIGLKSQIYLQLLNILSLPATWNGFDTNFVEQDIEAIKLIHASVDSDLAEDLEIVAGGTLEGDTLVAVKSLAEMEDVAKIVVEQEYRRLVVWINPTADSQDPLPNRSFKSKNYYGKGFWKTFAPRVWRVCPKLAVQLSARIASRSYNRSLTEFVSANAFYCIQFPEAIKQIAHVDTVHDTPLHLKYLPLWAPVPPIVAISFFLGEYKSNAALIQYGLRSLEQHSVDTVFFFVPQIVQSLRDDQLGYAEQFVVKTAKSAQLFAHQIIWNMNSNMYKGDHGDASLRVTTTL